MPTLGLAMIVKDGARTLARALDSARPWVDELLVVDTGSTDGTPALAEAHGARVVHHMWQGFADARNRSLADSRCDWVLVLDADEALDPATAPRLRELVAAGGLVGYHLLQRTVRPDGGHADVPMVRLFPRHPALRFEGVLHETLHADLPGFRFAPGAVVLWHHHDHLAPQEVAAKAGWYEALLRQAHEANPDDPAVLMHLGLALSGRQPERAVGLLLRAAQRAPAQAPYRASVHEGACVCLYQLGAYEEAAAQARKGLAAEPGFPPLLYDLALCLWRLGRGEEAIAPLDAAEAALPAYQGPLPIDPRLGGELIPVLRAALRNA